MTYNWYRDLDRCLINAGIPIECVSGWENRGRPSSTGQFNPSGVLCHHTASPKGTSDQSDLNVILSGNSEAPGPISQFLIGRQFHGVYLVAAGRANHGGSGLAPWMGQQKTDGNACMFGIEVANDGRGEYWPDWQIDLYAQTVMALYSWYNLPRDNIMTHRDFSEPYYPGSKVDPLGPTKLWPNESETWDIDEWKQFVYTKETEPHPEPPKPEPGDDVPRIGDALIQITDGSGKCYLTDGLMMTYRWIKDEQDLTDVRWHLVQAGLWPTEDTPPSPVDNLDAYGIEVR